MFNKILKYYEHFNVFFFTIALFVFLKKTCVWTFHVVELYVCFVWTVNCEHPSHENMKSMTHIFKQLHSTRKLKPVCHQKYIFRARVLAFCFLFWWRIYKQSWCGYIGFYSLSDYETNKIEIKRKEDPFYSCVPNISLKILLKLQICLTMNLRYS